MAPKHPAARLADEFVKSYPKGLPDRLAWLADQLRIDRPRFLRLLELAPEEVAANLGSPWEAIAERWPDQALWVEELLRELIAMFGYDWRALADRLHQLADAGAQPAGKLDRLRAASRVDREELLLALISQGGPDVLLWLLEYLRQPRRNGAVQK
jgi:hypothetical protein